MERQMVPSLHRLHKIQQQLHYLELDFLDSSTTSEELELLLSEETSILLQVFVYPPMVLVRSVYLVELQSQQSNHLLQVQFFQEYLETQRQDTSKYSKTSFHLVHLQYLENLHIQISTTHQHTLVLEMSPYLVLPRRRRISSRLDLVLLHSLVQLLSKSQQTIWKEPSSSTQKAPLHLQLSIKFTDTTETTEIQAHLVLQQYLVLVLQNQYRFMDTMETTKIQAHLEHLHSPIHLSYIHLSITHLRLVLVLQFSSRHLEQLSNLSRKATTRLKEDSKDLQVLKNPSVEQLMLVLVKLIPSELVKQNILLSRKEELTLSLFNSYK